MTSSFSDHLVMWKYITFLAKGSMYVGGSLFVAGAALGKVLVQPQRVLFF